MINYLLKSIPINIKVTLVSNLNINPRNYIEAFDRQLFSMFFDCDGKYPMFQRILAQRYVIDFLPESSFPIVFMDSDMLFLDFNAFWCSINEKANSLEESPCFILTERIPKLPVSRINGGFIGLLSKVPAQRAYSALCKIYAKFTPEYKAWWGDQVLLNIVDISEISSSPVLMLDCTKYNYSPWFPYPKKIPNISACLFCLQCIIRRPLMIHFKGARKILYRSNLFNQFLAFLINSY